MESLLVHRRRRSASRPHSRVRARWGSKRKGGFTLVELMAVIAIIAILAAIVVGIIVYAARKAAIANTRSLIDRLSLAINMYRADWGDYPPDGRHSTWGNDCSFCDAYQIHNLSTPAETLWFFLNGMFTVTTTEKGSQLAISDNELERLPRKGPYMDFREGELKHVDYEGLMWWDPVKKKIVDVPDLAGPGDAYPAVVDSWNIPIHYVAKDNWFVDSNPLVNEDSFDLVSRGPDRLMYGEKYNDPEKKENRDNITNFSYQDD
jgi:prepilin-type N-terminal cleavage/methylation domain-containing protein